MLSVQPALILLRKARADLSRLPFAPSHEPPSAIQLQGSTSAQNASPAPPKREINDNEYRSSPTTQHFSPYARPAIPSRLDQSYSAYASCPSNALVGRREEEDKSTDLTTLWDKFIRSNIGEQSIDWQLAKPTMAESLTLHLLEGEL